MNAKEYRRIRICLALFITGLVLSGITAFPLVHESAWLVHIAAHLGTNTALYEWLSEVNLALLVTSTYYPFLGYGTDWLAFSHLVIAAAFIGPWRDPVRNRWVLEFGLIACAGVIPLALIAGPIRGIPFYWRLGDCSFGIFGAIPLLIAIRSVNRIENRAGNPSAEA